MYYQSNYTKGFHREAQVLQGGGELVFRQAARGGPALGNLAVGEVLPAAKEKNFLA
ncbi:MAG: hypothetical protein ACRYFR_02885 [Janthinobacterium lividum]